MFPTPSLTLRSRSQTFFCLMKCLYHISQSSESIHISNRVCFRSITTDPRVHAMGWSWRSKYRTSSYSSEVEFSFIFFQMHFNFIGKARFRQATLSCHSSYCYLHLSVSEGRVYFCFSFLDVTSCKMHMGNTLVVKGGELDEPINITYTYSLYWEVNICY